MNYDLPKAKDSFIKGLISYQDVWAENPKIAVMNRETLLGLLEDTILERTPEGYKCVLVNPACPFYFSVIERENYPTNLTTFEVE